MEKSHLSGLAGPNTAAVVAATGCEKPSAATLVDQCKTIKAATEKLGLENRHEKLGLENRHSVSNGMHC